MVRTKQTARLHPPNYQRAVMAGSRKSRKSRSKSQQNYEIINVHELSRDLLDLSMGVDNNKSTFIERSTLTKLRALYNIKFNYIKLHKRSRLQNIQY